MAGATPKTVVNELSDDIVRFGITQKQSGLINELGWRKLLNRIISLGNNRDLLAPSLLMQATMHEIKGDVVQAKLAIDKYSARYEKTSDWYIIRASMAKIFGDPRLISEMVESAFPHGNIIKLQNALDVCANAGFYRSAYKALLEIEKINPGLAQQLMNTMPGLLPAARYLDDFNLDEVKISERILTLTKFVNDSGYMLRSSRTLTNDFGIIYEVVIDDNIEKLARLNLALYEILASNFDFTYSEYISVGVSPMENHCASK